MMSLKKQYAEWKKPYLKKVYNSRTDKTNLWQKNQKQRLTPGG